MWLAHLLRDATYAIDEGDEGFALGFRFLLLRAVAIGRRRDALKDSILAQYHGDLERRLDRLLAAAVPDKPAARRLFRAMRRDRDDLFRFIATQRDAKCDRKLWSKGRYRRLCIATDHWRELAHECGSLRRGEGSCGRLQGGECYPWLQRRR